jgi:hypothetical protein
MTDADPITPEPRRFWVRLPRPLWIGLTAIVLFFIGFGLRIGVPIYRQQEAIRELEGIDGRCHIEPGGPDWLRRWLGDEQMKPFDSVWYVDLSGTDATDNDVKQIAAFTSVRKLDLGETRVSSRCLYHLRGLPNLARIHLCGPRINDAGLEHLQFLPALEYIDLDGTAVTDGCLIYLKRCTHLGGIRLGGTQVTDAGLADLRRAMPHLDIGL